MDEQVDVYSSYETELDQLLNRLGQNHPFYLETLTYKTRLRENINQTQLHGDTETRRSERSQIMAQLNKLALSALGIPFSELHVTLQKESDECLPRINNPMSLVEPSVEGPVWIILERVQRAWSQANQEEAIRLCRGAMRCASDHPTRTGVAMAQLYLADAQARCNNIKDAVYYAGRAATNFGRVEKCHNQMVAHLLQARLTQASQNASDAMIFYEDALKACDHCQKLNKETDQGKQKVCRQIIEEIQQAQRDIYEDSTYQYIQGCLLKHIPILQLSDEPTVTLKSSKTVECVTIREFEIEGQIYFLHLLNGTEKYELELQADAIHFALPVFENGWLDPTSGTEDYVLMRLENEITHEGPGALWVENEWISGRFEQGASGHFRFVPQRPHIIGTLEVEQDTAEGLRFVPQQPRTTTGTLKATPCIAIALFRRAEEIWVET